jgi:hypothetical protein
MLPDEADVYCALQFSGGPWWNNARLNKVRELKWPETDSGKLDVVSQARIVVNWKTILRFQ